jgi:serpin B
MMKSHLHLLMAILIIPALLLSACGGGGTGQVTQSNLQRVALPSASKADVQALVEGNTAFAFDLYQALRSSSGNLVYSPYSISLAFAMAYGGAGGETASQIAQVLHYSLPQDQFHPAFDALDLELAQRAAQATGVTPSERFSLNIANALWGQSGWSFLPKFLDLLAADYGAGMRLVDFQKSPESARQQINNWVSDQTQRKILNLVPEGAIDTSTRLVLVNAIYYKAFWEYAFDPSRTGNEPFNLVDGSTVSVPMMSNEGQETLAYAAGDGYQAVALPYKGGLTEMVILVPDAGNFSKFEAALTPAAYQQILAALTPQSVILSMPKFNFDSQYELGDTLSSMGMPDAFLADKADFSGIDGAHDLFISSVIHQAAVAVDEKGTVAAAATAIVMSGAAMPSGIQLTIDRPFLFFIRDIPSGTILFMGRVLNPLSTGSN